MYWWALIQNPASFETEVSAFWNWSKRVIFSPCVDGRTMLYCQNTSEHSHATATIVSFVTGVMGMQITWWLCMVSSLNGARLSWRIATGATKGHNNSDVALIRRYQANCFGHVLTGTMTMRRKQRKWPSRRFWYMRASSCFWGRSSLPSLQTPWWGRWRGSRQRHISPHSLWPLSSRHWQATPVSSCPVCASRWRRRRRTFLSHSARYWCDGNS